MPQRRVESDVQGQDAMYPEVFLVYHRLSETAGKRRSKAVRCLPIREFGYGLEDRMEKIGGDCHCVSCLLLSACRVEAV